MIAPQPGAGMLSRPGEDDLAFLRQLAAETQTQATSDAPERSLLDEPELRPWKDRLLSAALIEGFEPLVLMPGISEDGLQALLRHCTVSLQAGAAQWRLDADARSTVLGEAARMQALPAAVRLARQSPGGSEAPSPLTLALVQLIREGIPSEAAVAAAGRELWPAYQAAAAVLRDGGILSEADADRLTGAVQLAELLEPLRFLIRWDPVSKTDAFFGRETELRQLRKFVDVLASQSLLESVQRGYSRFVDDESRALVLSGIGGVGKSTLLAKFLVDHAADKVPATRLVFSYLDFDRAAISGVQPATLLLELLRQLASQLPQVRPALDQLRTQVQENVATVAALPSFSGNDASSALAGMPRELIDRSQMNLYLELLARSLNDVHNERVMLIVLDTFEEVQLLGDEATVRVEGFIEDLLRVMPHMRVLIAGRDEAEGFFKAAARLALKGFGDKPSRRAFLETRGVPRKLSEQIAAQAGGRPLALLLAARLVSEFNEQSLDLSWMERFKVRLDETLTEGILYERILQHIPDERLRKIAHPGLILRRLDADAIVHVLAPTLGLGDLSLEAAEQLLALLRRQRDLVRIEPDGSVVHRPDVRGQMLQLMTLRDPGLVERLHLVAIEYYRARQSAAIGAQARTQAGIEEIYHLLCLGQYLERVLKLWSPAARLSLGRSVDEIANPNGRLALRVLLNRTVGIVESKELPQQLAQIYAENATRDALSERHPERALRIMERWQYAVAQPRRSPLLALTLDRNGLWRRAMQAFLETPPTPETPVEDLLAWADFLERARLDPKVRASLAAPLLTCITGRTHASAVNLAATRLQLRSGPFSKDLALRKDFSSQFLQPRSRIDGPLNPWGVTLGLVQPRPGLLSLLDLGSSDLQRRQARLLRDLCSNPRQIADRVIQRLCDALLSSNRPRELARVEKEEPWIEESYQTVLQHLTRPSTQQWYVPIAALLRREVERTAPLAKVLDLSLAERFEVRLPLQVSNTRALADVFRELDQLGLLSDTLHRSSKRAGSADLEELLAAYDDWRVDLMRVDLKFIPRLQYWNLG